MLHGYEMLYSLHAKVFQTLYDSQAEYEVVLRHVTQICQEDYNLEGRTKLGSYVELCFLSFPLLLSLKYCFSTEHLGLAITKRLRKRTSLFNISMSC